MQGHRSNDSAHGVFMHYYIYVDILAFFIFYSELPCNASKNITSANLEIKN